MKKEFVIIGSGFLLLSIIMGFLIIGNMFSIVGSDNEKVINKNPIELHLYPDTFEGYLKTRPGPGCMEKEVKPYEAYSGYYEQPLYWTGAERKLIGEFCTEKPILQIYSATANMYFEDWYGTSTRPPIYLGTTDNKELSNQNSTIGYTTVYSGTNYPERDVGLNSVILTEYVKGSNCFNIYALGGRYKCNVESGMDATINYIDISYDPVECLTDIECDDGLITTEDTCAEYICQNEVIVAQLPTKPSPSGLDTVLQSLTDWVFKMFSNVKDIISFSIIGSEELIAGDTETYNIHLTTNVPDMDYSDGYYETQYAYWALINKEKNIIMGEKKGLEVFGEYDIIVNITIPNIPNDYILMSTITQINSSYNYNTKKWNNTDEVIVKKEALNLKTKIPIPDKPQSSGLSDIFTNIADWLKSIFDIFKW